MEEAGGTEAGGLNRYLADCRARLGGQQRVRAVLGNEAGDLDSIACALALGRLRGCLPLLDMTPADLLLRPEAAELFAAAGVEASLLLFAPEVDLEGLQRAGRLSLVLVDHNELALHRAVLAPAVEEIVDHHPDRGHYPWVRARLIEPVGSAATLVTRLVRAASPALPDPATATLLLGPVLLDTADLSAPRTRPADREAAGLLREAAGPAAEGLFERLQAARLRPLPLDAAGHLRRDLKRGEAGGVHFGLATVYRSLEGWLAEEPALPGRLRSFAREMGLDLLLVLLVFPRAAALARAAGTPASPPADLRRTLLLHAQDPALARKTAAFLLSPAAGLELQARGAGAGTGPAPCGPEASRLEADDLRAWPLARPEMSRKLLLPLLEGFLRARPADRAAEQGNRLKK